MANIGGGSMRNFDYDMFFACIFEDSLNSRFEFVGDDHDLVFCGVVAPY